jgi:hypothetical protein
MTSSDLSRDVKTVALAICDGLSGPFSENVRKCIQEERWDDLTALKVDPKQFADASSYFRAVVPVSFLRKYEPLPTTIDRKQVAVDGFFEAERICYRTNQRLLPFIYNTYGVDDEAVLDFIQIIRKEMVATIGQRPPANPAGRFGPGSTYGDTGIFTTVPDKMSSSPTMTRDAWPFLVPWSGTLWGRAVASRSGSPQIVRGNRFTTVPKDCTKDRGICIGPSINLFFQLGFGRALRGRLRDSGIDLRNAQEKHRQVARAASISGAFATIDLRQASDTLASALVRLLLPHQWYEPLNDLRESITSIKLADGSTRDVVLEKFSAMGNGYTFELETAIFLAICRAVYVKNGCEPKPGENLHVFGDDIIVRTEYARDVIAALQYFGMTVNEDKTFVDGPFRESCGGDFFEGVDVRPYFLKKEPNEPQDYIAMANGIRALDPSGCFSTSYRGLDLRHAWFRCLGFLPVTIRRIRGPKVLGDLCVHDDPEFWQTRTRSSIRYIRVYRPARFKGVSWDHFDKDVLLAGACYGLPWNNGRVTPRDAVLGYKQGWVAYS